MPDAEHVKRYRGWVPDLGAFFQYQLPFNPSQHVRLSVTTRQLTYRDLIERKTVSSVGWGLQLSTMMSPIGPLTFYAVANGGRGVAGLGGDWSHGDYDLTPDAETPGRMYAPYVVGYMVGIQYNFTPMLFADIVYSRAHYYPGNHGSPADYMVGDYGSVNLFYYITPRVRAGVGFNVGHRENVDGEQRTAYRAGILAAFSF